jgi:O-antigen ligase
LPFLNYKIKAISSDDRFFLWDVAHAKVKSNYYFYGVGFGLSKQFIEGEMKNIEDTRIAYKGNEIHNQYLIFLLETGITGVLFLLFIYIRPNIYIHHNRKISTSLPLFSMIILIVMASIIEPFFNVIKGIVIFSLFSSLFKLVHIDCKKSQHFKKNSIIK